MSTLPVLERNDWGVAGNFSHYSSSRGALFPSIDSSAMNGSKKRPRVEKISSSRYRAYQGMRELIWGMRELILGYAGIDPGDCRPCATRSLFAAGSFFGTAKTECIVLAYEMNRSTFSCSEHRRASGVSINSWRTATSKRSFRKRTGSSCAAPCTQI